MDRPYIICHVATSVDGKITGEFLEKPECARAIEEYYRLHREFHADAFACGRITMEGSFTGGWYPDLTNFEGSKRNRKDYIAGEKAPFYAVAFDRKGRLGWKAAELSDEDPGYDKAHVIEVLCSDLVSDAYLAYLQSIGVSYIFAGRKRMNIELALQKLKKLFSINLLLLEGGSVLNGAFYRAGVIDELSLVRCPIPGQKSDLPIFYQSTDHEFSFSKIEPLDGNARWVYLHNRNNLRVVKLSLVINGIKLYVPGYDLYYDLKNHDYKTIPAARTNSDPYRLIRNSPDRYLCLPTVPNDQQLAILYAFVDQLQDAKIRSELQEAIRGEDPFNEFAASESYPTIRPQWIQYRENILKDLAIQWCKENNLDYD